MTALRRLDPLFVLLLLLATLALRLALPAGTMPVADQHGLRAQLCSGAGTTWVALDPAAPGPEQPRDPCPYGLALGAALDLPAPLLVPPPPADSAEARPAAATALALARRTLRPPARGPPLFA